MYEDEMKAKLKAAQDFGAGQCGTQAPSPNYDNSLNNAKMRLETPGGYYRPPTLCEEAEKNVGYHREQADKHDRAAAFFRENPAFDEFVRLVSQGVIQF